MAFKDQLNKLKENWLIIAVVLVMLFLFSGIGSIGSLGVGSLDYMSAGMEMGESYYGAEKYYSPRSQVYIDEDFAPEVEDRIITKSASLSTEIERGEFQSAQSQIKSITYSSDSFVLDENVRKNGVGKKSYYTASYQIKVDSKKYDSVVAQLKEIGEVQYFTENTDDITGQYTNTETEIMVEKQRLARYEGMFDRATEVSDQIELSDRIFDQERKIAYYEQRLSNMDSRVEYSTISVSMSEERSDYINVVLVKFSKLIENIVNSFNSLLSLIAWLLPWAVGFLIFKFGKKLIKRRTN